MVLLALLLGAASSRPVLAAEGDALFPSDPSKEMITFQQMRVVLFGPVSVPPQVRSGTEEVSFRFEGVDMGGKAASSALYVVNASPDRKGPLVIDDTDFIGSIAGMRGSPAHLIGRVVSVHDYEVNGHPHGPLTHLRSWDRVMLAVAIRDGDFKFKRIVLTTHAFDDPQVPVTP
jgi:hypothetical protein